MLEWVGSCAPLRASQCDERAVLKHKLKETVSTGETTLIGVDLAKTMFRVHAAEANASMLFRKLASGLNHLVPLSVAAESGWRFEPSL
jgi:uncharacterized SAM-dependent methyltransferase